MKRFPASFFVTGTDTGIGKTLVSSILALGLNGTYWKPIQSGTREETDSQCIRRIAGIPSHRILNERFTLTEPLSPHASAKIDGVKIRLKDFQLPKVETGHLIVEGAGGLMVPINDRQMIIDLIRHLDLPVVLVCSSGLGTLNHTFLSLESMRNRNIEILGVILNGPVNKSNRRAIERYGKTTVLAELEPLDRIDRKTLTGLYGKIF